MAEGREVLLEVLDLYKHYPIEQGFMKRSDKVVRAVDGLSLNVYAGETLGLVGESGCGKTTFGKCAVRLQTPTKGAMLYRSEDGRMCDLLALNKQDSFQMRKKIQIIFQDPYSSFNPVKTIRASFDEPLRIHGFGTKPQRTEIIADILETVNLYPDYMYRYPHEFSGGQRQRIAIARALCLQPDLIVCDEPVSALDVSIQAQVLNLMREIQRAKGLSYIFIAHDLSVVEYMSDRIAVMYLGKVVELLAAKELSRNVLHPYTKALLSAIPIPKIDAKRDRTILQGDVPSPINPPSGCRFHTRCSYCIDICNKEEPPLRHIPGDNGHKVACHLYKG